MKYLITGTGRSGTTLIHSVLTDLGLDMGKHEKYMGKHGGVGGYRVIPDLVKNNSSYEIIIQAREPLETVTSILKSSPSDFPDLNLYKKDYKNIELYTLKAWYEIHHTLYKKSIFNYTLQDLNEGKASSSLISLFNLNISSDKFNKTVLSKLNSPKRNSRPSRKLVDPKVLKKLDPHLFKNSYNLYNKIKI